MYCTGAAGEECPPHHWCCRCPVAHTGVVRRCFRSHWCHALVLQVRSAQSPEADRLLPAPQVCHSLLSVIPCSPLPRCTPLRCLQVISFSPRCPPLPPPGPSLHSPGLSLAPFPPGVFLVTPALVRKEILVGKGPTVLVDCIGREGPLWKGQNKDCHALSATPFSTRD